MMSLISDGSRGCPVSSAAGGDQDEQQGHRFIEHLIGAPSDTIIKEQMELICQLSAAVQKLSSAVDSNSVTINRLENTVDKMCAMQEQQQKQQQAQHSAQNHESNNHECRPSGNASVIDDDDISDLPDDFGVPRSDDAALDRKQVRLDGLEVYAVVSAVTAGTLVAVFDSYHPGNILDLFEHGRYLEVLVSLIFFATGSTGIVCGLHCIFVFSLVTMYGRTALGMERDDALEVFFAGTGLQRYHGFKTFVGSLYSMMILLIVSITSKVSDNPWVHLVALGVTARLMFYVYDDTQTIMEKAGVIFSPPPSHVAEESDVEDAKNKDSDDDSIQIFQLSRRPSLVSATTGESSSKKGSRKALVKMRQSSLTIGAEELIKLRENGRSPSPSEPAIEEVPTIVFSPSRESEANASRHKILKVLKALDPRADNFHKGKERANRLSKFRSFVDGNYTNGIPPTFLDEDITLLFLGTSDEGDRALPGLLRACGVPSKNHQGAGDHILLKKSAHDAIGLLRYLICDLGTRIEQSAFSKVFCLLPPSELLQLRLSLHIAGFGGKREGSKEDACQILAHYLHGNTKSETRRTAILDDILPAQDARIALRGWIAQQPEDVQASARALAYFNRDGSFRSVLSGGGDTDTGTNKSLSRSRGRSLPPKKDVRK